MGMKNKIVIFSNIKGGVGKTTLCALFANHLIEHGFPSFVIDADLQASLFRHRQRERTPHRTRRFRGTWRCLTRPTISGSCR